MVQSHAEQTVICIDSTHLDSNWDSNSHTCTMAACILGQSPPAPVTFNVVVRDELVVNILSGPLVRLSSVNVYSTCLLFQLQRI